MPVERAAALIVLVLPALVATCAGAWKVFTWVMDRHDDAVAARPAASAPAPIVQGQVIPAPSDQWATRAYEGLERELKDEQADHARTINRHRMCHALMQDHGIPVPDDH